jgi:threonine dehydrogenase-like Zn-dependent dehydrogenase
MGSAAEFHSLCKFLTEKKISLEALVDSVFKGLENTEEAFEKMKNGTQFGYISEDSANIREIGHFYVPR